MTWQERAACANTDSRLFFPIKRELSKEKYNEIVERALAVCASCMVQEPCKAFGEDMEYGIWGGEVK